MSDHGEHPQRTAFLREQRWFAGKGREFTVSDVRVVARLEENVRIELVTVRYAEGQPSEEVYQMPVVAYPEAPWTTSWQDSLRMVGEALGRTTLAEQVAADTEATIDQAKADNPDLQGASLIYGYLATTDLSTVGIYAPQDPRVSILRDLGMVDAPAVADAIKPDAAIYEAHTKSFGLDPAATIFIDDAPANIEGAKGFGWNAVLFTGAGKLRSDLAAHGLKV